jgi:hypothetical protein
MPFLSSSLQDAQVCADRAKQTLDRITALASFNSGGLSRSQLLLGTYSGSQPILYCLLSLGIDLRKLDAELRNDVQLICDIKNRSIEHTIFLLRQISSLQSDLSEIPSDLTSLEAELRNKAGFSHLQRLHHMLYMYGATLVEVVRRKEFGESFGDWLLYNI